MVGAVVTARKGGMQGKGSKGWAERRGRGQQGQRSEFGRLGQL